MPFVEAKCTSCGATLPVDSARDAWVCGYCGTPFVVEKAIQQFNITNNITAGTVVVQAAQNDFEIRGGVLVKYNGSATEVEVPEGVVEIGRKAFADCKNLVGIVFPEGLEKIGAYAFQGCSRLSAITFPKSLYPTVDSNNRISWMGYNVFSGCTSIEVISFLARETTKGCYAVRNSVGDFPSAKKVLSYFPKPGIVLPDSVPLKDRYVKATMHDDIAIEERKRWECIERSVCYVCGGKVKGAFTEKFRCKSCGKEF